MPHPLAVPASRPVHCTVLGAPASFLARRTTLGASAFGALFLVGLPSALLAQGTAATTGRAMRLDDWYRVTQLSQPAMSPDGRHVAMTVTTVHGTSGLASECTGTR